MSTPCVRIFAKESSTPLKRLDGYIFHLFVDVFVNTVIIFFTFATPKMWIQQCNSEDGYDILTQELQQQLTFVNKSFKQFLREAK